MLKLFLKTLSVLPIFTESPHASTTSRSNCKPQTPYFRNSSRNEPAGQLRQPVLNKNNLLE
jgi:hypothetical protein